MLRSRGGSGRLGTFTQTVTALAALGALVFTGVSLSVTQDQNEAQNHLAAQSQYTDRYTKAVEQLGQQGADRLQIRLGGIYALERLARDSPRDQPTILEVLSAFVRTNNPRAANDKDSRPVPPTTDAQAVLTVLGRRDTSHDNSTRLDLSKSNLGSTDLSHANLSTARLGDAYLADANLAGAYLAKANLVGAYLIETNLRDAYLSSANLRSAFLRDAYLRDAYVGQADLRDAYLGDADLSSAYVGDADLSGANLENANLSGANLENANLSGANLSGANLSGANLSGAKHDARTRIDQVHADGRTRWW